MIIDLKSIPQTGIKDFVFSLEKDWWQPDWPDDQVLGLESPLNARVEIYRAGNKYVIQGSLEGVVRLECDRCLEPYKKDIRQEFKMFLTQPASGMEKAEVELLEEDMEVGFISGEELELYEVIREQVYLALPIKSLCTEECLGLCPKCGGNLNEEGCQCELQQGHPGFSKLKNLKIEGE